MWSPLLSSSTPALNCDDYSDNDDDDDDVLADKVLAFPLFWHIDSHAVLAIRRKCVGSTFRLAMYIIV